MLKFNLIVMLQIILALFMSHDVYAKVLQDSHRIVFQFSEEPPEDILDIDYDTQDKKYEVLSNSVYRNERIRIFSYTAYDSNQMNNRLKSGNLDLENFGDLSISFGYGIEFRVNYLNKIGYEYLSTFPYDRGQLIRLFWVHAW